jgi:hypothetical protein
MSLELPMPISNYIEAVNTQDVDAMLAAFSHEATVRDEGRERIGRAAIYEWIEETTRKYGITLTIRGVDNSGGNTVVTAQISGTFPGSPIELRYHFTVTGEKIARLEIN